MLHLTIPGSVPSKKNNRVPFVRNGRMMNFPNKAYMAWEKAALVALKEQKVTKLRYPVQVNVGIYMKDNRGRDLDNMLGSIMDCLQKSGVLEDDDWQHVPRIALGSMGIDKTWPRAEVTISEL